MTNLYSQKVKSFSGEQNNSNIFDIKSLKLKDDQIVDHYPLEIAIVTICLTSNHKECSGQYVDSFGKFLIKCLCKCHTTSKIEVEKNLTDNYSISSNLRVVPPD